MSLTEESRKKLEEYYLKNIPTCDKCGSNENVLYTIFGRPSKELYLFVEEHPNKLTLGGCCPGEHAYECVTCKHSFSKST